MVTRTPKSAATKAAAVPAVEEVVKAAVPTPADPVPPAVETAAEMVVEKVEQVKQSASKSTAKVAAATAETVDAAASVSKAATDPMNRNLEQAVAYTKEKVEKMNKQVFTAFDDVATFHKDNVEAFVTSSTILAKGLEAVSKELLSFHQSQYENGVSAAKALGGVKSLKELVDLQAAFAKASFDAFLAEATKVSESGMKIVNEASEPLTARVNATVEKLSKAKAAA